MQIKSMIGEIITQTLHSHLESACDDVKTLQGLDEAMKEELTRALSNYLNRTG